MRKGWLSLALVAALVLTGCTSKSPTNPANPGGNYGKSGNQTQSQPQQKTGQTKTWTSPPAMEIDPNKTYTATIKTSLGDVTVELFAKDAPKTVNNFVFLARQKFYDGVIFHRIIKDFMIQTGDPQGTGSGGPGYRFQDELPVKRSYDPGIVAMANAGPNTNGSQFFICNGANCKSLNQQPNYTQFGKVTAGMDVVQKLSSVEVGPDQRGEPSKPKNPPVIQTIIIDEK
jgi:cyclophilin family peptidyl-prolyl cis-trans isomerase